MSEVHAIGGNTLRGYPEEVRRLAEALAAVHGDVSVTTEKHGIHIYLCDPELLQTDGAKELSSRHLAVNASKFLGLSGYENLRPGKRRYAASCMKTGKSYAIDALLSWVPLSQRGYPGMKAGAVKASVQKGVWIKDLAGNTIPDHPGDVIPVTDLPDGHPAVLYLRGRGFDLQLLARQQRAAYCVRHAPEVRDGEGNSVRGYGRLVDGWMNSPQGRIIFYGDIRGAQTIWQGRYIEHTDGNTHYVWHPFRDCWCVDKTRASADAPWELVPPYDGVDKHGNPIWKHLAKYFTTPGAPRTLIGFDAAVAWNANRSRSQRFCLLVEGPLDAGKPGPPAICIVGKYLSGSQAALLASEFPTVLVGYDNDDAGREQRSRAESELALAGAFPLPIYPDAEGKDWGDMTRTACWFNIVKTLQAYSIW